MAGAGVETVTILITDLVGSTRLASGVGAIVAEELREEHFGLLREAIEETGGREVKNTGDGVMVAFGSAAAAVSCAVSVQQRFERRNRSAAEPLLIKVGVSAGDASTAEGDVFGMPVIEAARLCERCSAGQILAKELVAHLAAGRGQTFRSVGGLDLKGLPGALEAVEVEWEPILSSAIALPERLRELPVDGYVGRVSEREKLGELWRAAGEGSLRLALISGEAGVGKTRLATNLALHAHGGGATVLYGVCDEDLGVPYQPWIQALRFLVGEVPSSLLDRHVKREGGALAQLVPALRERLGELPAAREGDPETERYLLYAAVAGLLEVAGEQEPLLLILDDLHWADGQSVALLRHIVTATGSSMPVMVVGTYRDSDLSRDHPLTALLADLHREQGVERFELTGLDAEEVLALVHAAGYEPGEAGRALAEEITRETTGNPFFAGELLRHLSESGPVAQEEGGHWRLLTDLADLGLPQSVREVIGRRVERLGPDARTALSTAAVIGRIFDLELLLSVLELSEARLLDLLEEAVAASLVSESSDRAGRFAFIHGLVEHTLYEDLGRTRRARLHTRIAEALEEQCSHAAGERLVSELSEAIGSAGGSAAILAYHWREGGHLDRTLQYLLMAAELAGRGGAQAEAVTLYNQALDLIPADDSQRRREVLLKRAIAYARFSHTVFGDA